MKRLAFALIGLASCSTDTFSGGGDSGTDGAVDAQNDGGTTGDGSSCATPPACSAVEECNAFDDTQQSSYAPFSDVSQSPGTLAFSTDQFVSCPRSVVATLASGVNGARAALGASKTITDAVSAHARIELDVLLPKNVTGGSTFLVLYANGDAAGSAVSLESAGGQWYVRLRATNGQKSITPRVGAWNHVALDVTFSASTSLGKATFEYVDANGTKQTAPLQDRTLPGGTATITQVAFSAGIVPFTSISAEMMTFMDDVVFTPQ
jgi:hypothetical protein